MRACRAFFARSRAREGSAATRRFARSRGVGAALIADIEKQLAEDTPIWENKAHLEHPALCPDDGPISLLRRWAKQFYPVASGSNLR